VSKPTSMGDYVEDCEECKRVSKSMRNGETESFGLNLQSTLLFYPEPPKNRDFDSHSKIIPSA
jgi:hypothetical protein